MVGFVLSYYEEGEGINDKARHHCHLIGRCRGAGQTSCNVNVKQNYSSFIPIELRKLTNYDSHLFFKELTEKILT